MRDREGGPAAGVYCGATGSFTLADALWKLQDDSERSDHIPLCQVHDGRTLVLPDVLVRVQANEQLVSKTSRLQHDARVAMVKEVEAAIDPDPFISSHDVLLRTYWPFARPRDFFASVWIYGSHLRRHEKGTSSSWMLKFAHSTSVETCYGMNIGEISSVGMKWCFETFTRNTCQSRGTTSFQSLDLRNWKSERPSSLCNNHITIPTRSHAVSSPHSLLLAAGDPSPQHCRRQERQRAGTYHRITTFILKAAY